MAIKPITHKAPKKQTMTLRDIEAWVKDARDSGATGDEHPEGTVSWKSGIESLSIDVEMVPQDTP